MPGRDGLETAKELKRQDPKVRVLMLTVHPEDNFAVRCLTEGADRLYDKGHGTGAVDSGPPPDSTRRQVHQPQSRGNGLALNLGEGFERPVHDALSTREFAGDAADRLREDAVSEIGVELHLSVKTISTYRHRILEKMNLRNNSEIVRYAVEKGFTA